MKGLFKFLAPFAPDYSGAVSVLFELGGIIVIYDAGGCTGNICGYDEPRWYGSKTALLSAGLRDMDAIFGRDDKLVDKIADAVDNIPCRFIAIICTPAPAVIGTDFKALARAAHSRTGLPVVAVGTNGMELYDRGQDKAYMSLFKAFAEDNTEHAADIGIIGATPLDMPDLNCGSYLMNLLHEWGYNDPACYGMGSGLTEIKNAGSALCNLVVSPSGLKTARWLKDRFGTPYVPGFSITDTDSSLRIKIKDAIEGKPQHKTSCAEAYSSNNQHLLIIHQQVMANSLREYICKKYACSGIDVATWFILDEAISEQDDTALKEEDDLISIITKNKYDLIIGDPLFRRTIPDWNGVYLNMPHYAVSGRLYGSTLEDLLKQIEHCMVKSHR